MGPKLRPQVALGRDDRLMTWCSNLNIYRVNRFHRLELESEKERRKAQNDRFDIVEELLARNMVHVVESIFSYVGYESTCDCLCVCKLWYEFLSTHLFKRWAETMIEADPTLQELAVAEKWTPHLHADDVEDFAVYRKMCFRIHQLREVWRFREPKVRRLFCDSFVLSLRFRDSSLFCGLNNGCLQLWDLKWCAKQKEQEIHDKGVKCLDLDEHIIVTGSYDCTAKVWTRTSWDHLYTISLHNDSVWDLKLHDNVLATAGLDGTVGVFEIAEELTTDIVTVRYLIQAHEDLVAAVDFNSSIMVTGYEDSRISVWNISNGTMRTVLYGHNGGVTGIQLSGETIAASSSYDGTARLWDCARGTCLRTFEEPQHFVRCVAFMGNTLACGDFGGHVHLWDIVVEEVDGTVRVRNYRDFTSAHKGHVVCLQLNARRIVSGSRDKTALVHDFWGKMMDNEASQRRRNVETKKESRFLRARY